MLELIVLLLAGSLDNLQNETLSELAYRTEMDNFIVSHNITCCLNFNELPDDQLEAIIKRHMKECASGHHDYMVRQIINMHLDNKTQSEMLGSYGDC